MPINNVYMAPSINMNASLIILKWGSRVHERAIRLLDDGFVVYPIHDRVSILYSMLAMISSHWETTWANGALSCGSSNTFFRACLR